MADEEPIHRAMTMLVAAEHGRRNAIAELMRLGVIRSRSLVGDLGEALAAAFYGVDLVPPSTPGFDLVTRDGRRVQVRTLRCTSTNFRTTVGVMREPYDALFAIRLDEEYRPTEAIEVPRPVVEEHFRFGRVSWTKRLASDHRVRSVSAAELLPPT